MPAGLPRQRAVARKERVEPWYMGASDTLKGKLGGGGLAGCTEPGQRLW
jgi:hypothetical protein